MNKTYTAKIYTLAGAYVTTINPKLIQNEPRFASRVGGGQGELVLDLALPITSFGEGTSIKAMNVVRLYEVDEPTTEGEVLFHTSPVLIYTGYISQYVPYFDEIKEGVRLTVLGLVSLLSLAYFKSGASFLVAKSGDPGQIVRDIVDHFSASYAGLISYAADSVVDVGTSVSVTYNDQKWIDAIRKAYELGATNRFWSVYPDGKIHFREKQSPADDHKFTIGLNASLGEIVKNSEQIVNSYQLRWGPGPTVTTYTDAGSIAAYGLHELVESDSEITDLASANQKGNKKIADYKNPRVQAKLRVNATYDIETIRPGHSCSVLNKETGSTLFNSNMMVTSVSYGPDAVDLELENEKGSFADALADAVEAI